MKRNVFRGSRKYPPRYLALSLKQLRYDNKNRRQELVKKSIGGEYLELELEKQMKAEKNNRILYKENIPLPIHGLENIFEHVPSMIKKVFPERGILLASPSPEIPGVLFAEILMHQSSAIELIHFADDFSHTPISNHLGIAEDMLIDRLKSICEAPILIIRIPKEYP